MQRVKRIADAMSADSPHRFVATVIKSKRKGKDPHRLFAQWTRFDRRRAVFATRAAWRR